jgi:hypothetical protein
MAFRDLAPLSVFFLDADPFAAARALCDIHVCSQARALPIATCQIARELGVDVSGLPRKGGTYPDHALSLAGCWAASTVGNWLWFSNYALAILDEFEHRYGRRHASADYLEWLWAAMDAARACPPRGPRTLPPVPGETCLDQAAVLAASRALYEEAASRATYTHRDPPAWMLWGAGGPALIIDHEAEDLPARSAGPAITFHRARLLGAA